ncbi:hypothetical protein GQ457_18G022070 [Hibiscus cannabinus]
MGSLHTEYLGLLLGVRHNSINLWEPILKKLSTKLVSWKSQLLYFGGKISLVKSILGCANNLCPQNFIFPKF